MMRLVIPAGLSVLIAGGPLLQASAWAAESVPRVPKRVVCGTPTLPPHPALPAYHATPPGVKNSCGKEQYAAMTAAMKAKAEEFYLEQQGLYEKVKFALAKQNGRFCGVTLKTYLAARKKSYADFFKEMRAEVDEFERSCGVL